MSKQKLIDRIEYLDDEQSQAVFLVYKTDSWHTYKSRELIGVCTSDEQVMRIIIERIEKEFGEWDTEFIEHLKTMRQSQCYIGEGEFQYEPVELNVLI